MLYIDTYTKPLIPKMRSMHILLAKFRYWSRPVWKVHEALIRSLNRYVVGGSFCLELPGIVCRGYCRATSAREFAECHGIQETMRFSVASHGRDEALWLCTAWCTRMSALHQLWQESGFAAEWWSPDLEPAVTPLELVESLLGADQDGEFHRRGMIFHAMWPGPYRPPKAKKKTSKKPRRTA